MIIVYVYVPLYVQMIIVYVYVPLYVYAYTRVPLTVVRTPFVDLKYISF